MANPLDPTFSPLTTRTAVPPLPTAEDYAAQIRAAGLTPRQGFVEEPEMPSVRTARLAYSPSQKKFFVGGYTFDDDDDTSAVTFSKYANQEAPLPEGDWQEIDPASYAQYVQGIRSPGFFQQIANNFDIGLDEMQQTLGYGLMFAGAEETGRWLADQESDLAKTQVYQRNIENIGENGVLDWIAATIGRFGPNVVESVITAGAGAAIGSAATPAGTGAGAALGFFGKTAVKKALYEAAKKQFKGQALDAAEKKLLLSAAGMTNAASNAAKTKLAPGAFNEFMREGLQTGAESVARRVAARAPTEIGAVGLSTASNIFQQTGQAYGETMAGGGEGDRAVALGIGTLGGLADTAGEFLLAGRVFSEAVGDVAGSVTKRQKAVDILKRVGAGAGVGAGMEGTTEAFQEALQIAANPVVNVETPEGLSRLLNAFAGGALLGGAFGGAGGIFAGSLADNKNEANLLLPVSKDDPNYAQYREDVKRQLGEAEYNKVFGPPQPYTQIMEEQAATQDMIAGIGGARRFAGTQAPLTGPDETFKVGPTPAIPNMIPGPAFGTTGAATATLPQGMQVTPTPGAMTIGAPSARPPAAPAPAPAAPPVTGTGLAMGTTMAPGQMGGMGTFEQFQAAAMQQAMAAQQAAAAPAPVPPSVQELRGVGIPQPAAAGAAPLPGGESINARLLRRGATPQAAPPAQQRTPRQVVEQGPLRMAGQAPASMVQPLRPTRVLEGFPQRMAGQAPARMVQPLRAAAVETFSPNVRNALPAIRSFIRRMVVAGKDTFTEADVGKFLFPLKAKLDAKQKNQVQRLADTMVEGNIAVRDPQRPDTYSINTEVVSGFEPGAGGASLRTLAEIPADRPVGEQPPAGPGAGGTAGKGNRLRAKQPPAAKTEEQGPPAGGQQAQTEEAVQPAVKPRRKPLKKDEEPPGPKGEGVAATPSKTAAELKAEEKARKAAEAKAEEDRKTAEKIAKTSASGKYAGLSESTINELANDGKNNGTLIANKDPKAPKKPIASDAKANKAAQDIYEVYEAISNVITAKRVRARVVDLDAKDEAKILFLDSTKFLYGWVNNRNVHPQARNIARAYLEKYISTDETLAGVKQAVKSAEETGMFKVSDFDALLNPIDEDGRPAKGVNPIRVKAIVDGFKRGLAKAPQFYIYRNQADLQRRNPSLYQQAVGSRPQGDFDAVRASGFAFDGKVLVFTDRVPTEKYMRLLLAHESIGHFGMRSLLPAKQFDALMDYVYDNNAKLRLKVDAQLAGNTDLGARREAVEEYMAKYAEKLDSSVITRVWNAIKDVLNKLGVKFEDDIVRYLVSQARRTVREGSSAFTPSTFALNVHTITTNNGTGRFSTEPIYTAQHAMRNRLAIMDAQPANLGEVKQALKDWKVTSADLLEVMTRNVFRLRNYNALRNHGAQAFEYLKDAMRSAAQTLRNVYNERLGTMLALTGESRRAFSNAMVVSRRIADRRFALDKELRNAALLTLGDEQPDGFRELTVNEPVLKRLIELGTLSKDELDNGAEVTYEEPDANGKIVKTKVKIPGVKELVGRELTKEEYDLYVKTRKDLADLDIERLKGQYQNFLATEKVTTKGIRKVLADKNMTDDDVAFVRNIVNHAKKLFIDDIDYDERGIPAVTPETAVRMEQYFKAINTAVVKREFTDDLKAEVRKFYLPKPKKGETVAADTTNKAADAAIKRIEEFRSRRTEFTGREEQGVIYTLQDRVKEIVLADAAFDKAQMAVRRSIASSHVPLWREGSWQVRVEAQINGKPVKLHPEVQNKMLFSLSENVAGAENDAKFFNDSMKDVEYSGLVYNEENGEYKTQKFTLFARPSKAVESVASDPSIDIDNFLYTLRVLGQPLTPDKHAKAITMLTAPGSALRKALRFDDTPGYDPDKSVEAIARHVTTRSSLIARTRFQPFMRELMNLSTDSGKRWFGDAEVVMDAKDNLDKATTDKAKAYWQDRLTTELYKYVTTNPGAKGWDGSRAKFVSRPEKADLGMRDYSDAVKELEWLMDSANISESTFEGKRLAALAKMVTSVGFLGGMFTQFAQNLMSPATNVLPYLASKDSQTGFGGGFGMSVIPTYMTAFKDVVGLRGLNPFTDPIKDAEAFENIANTIKVARDAKDTAKEAELVQQYGLSYYEALNIAREIREGKLIPAQANAMLETARGIFTGTASKLWLKFSDIYMSPFNVSEQATRRATFLTAFRLEFDRLKQAGFNEDKASEMARMFAIDTVDKTLGEYSNTNRPPVWRDGWQSLLFVYKTYPLTSLLLFKNMSRAGKIGMLTALWVLAGAAGFPLVDDMEDLIDTLSQRMGLDLGQGPSIRMAIINQLEEFFPGWSDMILRGPMNHFTGADVGAKFGLEDFIPGTGILLKGANTTEELKSIAGPVVGMGLSMSKFVYDLGRAPLSSTTSLLDATREAPISLIRAAGDVAAYMQNGAIVDRRGYVVSPEVNAMTMVSRLLGFYPAEAAKQYDFIKYANRMNYDYKEVGTAYKLAWVKAKLTGDDRQAARIVREVNEWNESNQGGPGVIRNFLKNAQRALKEARRPAGERFLKSAPVASRASYERFLEYITAE